MNRRTALQHLTLLAGGAALLPACQPQTNAAQEASIPLKHVAVSATQEKLLAEVCETILPRTDTPGAKDLGLHLYVLKMLDDCTAAAEQQAFSRGLAQLDDAARRQHGQAFAASTAPQRLALLQGIGQQKDYSADLVSFCRTARQLTIDGYTSSQYFMTRQLVYELVPGRYSGYFPVSKTRFSTPA